MPCTPWILVCNKKKLWKEEKHLSDTNHSGYARFFEMTTNTSIQKLSSASCHSKPFRPVFTCQIFSRLIIFSDFCRHFFEWLPKRYSNSFFPAFSWKLWEKIFPINMTIDHYDQLNYGNNFACCNSI